MDEKTDLLRKELKELEKSISDMNDRKQEIESELDRKDEILEEIEDLDQKIADLTYDFNYELENLKGERRDLLFALKRF